MFLRVRNAGGGAAMAMVAVLVMLVNLGITGALVWAAVHFIRKFW